MRNLYESKEKNAKAYLLVCLLYGAFMLEGCSLKECADEEDRERGCIQKEYRL